MRLSVWTQAVLVAGFAAGCHGGDHDIEVRFEVRDQDGAPITGASISCSGELDHGDFIGTERGEIVYYGGAEYGCVISDEASPRTITVSRRDALVEAYSFSRDEVLVLRIWQPELTFEEVGDELVVSWDATVPTPLELPQPEPRLYGEAFGRWDVAPGVTSASFPRDLLEDAEPTFFLDAYLNSSNGDIFYETAPVTAALAPVVPPSRGAACEVVVHDEPVGGPPGPSRTESYGAGECPYTDGNLTGSPSCGERCDVEFVTIDLGSEQPIGRVVARLRSDFATVAGVSLDGATFTNVPSYELLEPPVTGRYVRAFGLYLSEVSVFAPPPPG